MKIYIVLDNSAYGLSSKLIKPHPSSSSNTRNLPIISAHLSKDSAKKKCLSLQKEYDLYEDSFVYIEVESDMEVR